MECLGRYTFLVMTEFWDPFGLQKWTPWWEFDTVLLHPPWGRGGASVYCLNRDEHGMLREVYISGHDFCHTFRWYENESRAWNA